MRAPNLIEASYIHYRQSVLSYIHYKINNREDAEDLTQDTFLRLMDYKQMLREETVKHFIFTIARNLVTDYLRRHYRTMEMQSYFVENSLDYCNATENEIITKDLLRHEKMKVENLPNQRKLIYSLHRFEEKSISEISLALDLSTRTVENHLFISRREVREYMKKCI